MDLLYRPKFCSNCGERIERAEWRLWTSGRFCPVCEIEHKGRELLPKAVLGVASLIILAGGFSLISGSGRADVPRPAALRSSLTTVQAAARPEEGPVASQPSPSPAVAAAMPVSSPRAAPVKPLVAADAAYVCGAETKKGTPCSRRVKGNVRCWQHLGMPSMPGADRRVGA